MNNQILDGVSLADLIKIVRVACGEILEVKKNFDLNVREKSDRSPVTAADLAASSYILKSLRALNSSVTAISEEEISEVANAAPCYWLIDPLDGTKEFLKGSIEYTVNIALIAKDNPVFGIIAVPETGDVYYGGVEFAATAVNESGFSQPISCRSFRPAEVRCLISSSHKSNEEMVCKGIFQNLRIENVGSSLKYCYIASGRSDFSFRKGPTSIWDTGAAHAILRSAGGEMLGPCGKALTYDPGKLLNPPFIAVGDPSHDWSELLAAL